MQKELRTMRIGVLKLDNPTIKLKCFLVSSTRSITSTKNIIVMTMVLHWLILLIDLSTNQSSHWPIDQQSPQPIHWPINQVITKFVGLGWSVNWLIVLSNDWLDLYIYRLIGWWLGQLISQLIGRRLSRVVDQLVDWLVDSLVGRSMNLSMA